MIKKKLRALIAVFAVLCFGSSCSHSNDSQYSATVINLQAIEEFPFAQTATIRADNLDLLDSISFSVRTKPGNVSKDINVTYTLDYLKQSGRVNSDTQTVDVPIFGLYADYINEVVLTLRWRNDSSKMSITFPVKTSSYTSSLKITNVTVSVKYADPKTNYLLIESNPASPLIMDIDGEVRWQSVVNEAFLQPVYVDITGFLVGSTTDGELRLIDFSGSMKEVYALNDQRYLGMKHNIEPGKSGLFASVGFRDNAVYKPESVLIEFTHKGEILKTWDFDAIIGGAITTNGEDPSFLVQNGVDWFHMNSSIYSPTDDTVIVSSRENFVVKIDYSTGKIRWILGNKQKLWYQNYPASLQPLALTVIGNPPIGQHALSLVGDEHYLLLLNNGHGNEYLSDVGDTRDYSMVSLYEIDETRMMAKEIWNFDADNKLYSPIGGSVYKTDSGDYLINFATTEHETVARIMVIDANKNVLFSMSIPKRGIDINSSFTAYRVREIKLESLRLE
jgi:arylsulfate sulfotransferase